MSNLDLSIGGRRYAVACTDGEEAHVAELGAIIDTAITAHGLRAQSENRMMLFAALMLADELHTARRALAEVSAPPQPDPDVQARVEAIAARLEVLAQSLVPTP